MQAGRGPGRSKEGWREGGGKVRMGAGDRDRGERGRKR